MYKSNTVLPNIILEPYLMIHMISVTINICVESGPVQTPYDLISL